MTFHVRIEFTWFGERVHEFVGPFTDRWAADLFLAGCSAGVPYIFGITPVHIERARIVAG